MNAGSKSVDFDLVRICLAGLLGVVFVILLAADAAGGDEPPAGKGEALRLTEYDLLSRADTLEPRPYWVGRQPGTDSFELEVGADGNAYVRYLTEDTAPEEPLTVGTYVVSEAQARLERAARAAGEYEHLSRGEGFTAFAGDGDSAYVVFGELPEVQVEVYAPGPEVAKDLVLSGAVTPLHWTPLGD